MKAKPFESVTVTICVYLRIFYHGVHGVSRRKRWFSYQNSVVLRGYILLKLTLMVTVTFWGICVLGVKSSGEISKNREKITDNK